MWTVKSDLSSEIPGLSQAPPTNTGQMWSNKTKKGCTVKKKWSFLSTLPVRQQNKLTNHSCWFLSCGSSETSLHITVKLWGLLWVWRCVMDEWDKQVTSAWRPGSVCETNSWNQPSHRNPKVFYDDIQTSFKRHLQSFSSALFCSFHTWTRQNVMLTGRTGGRFRSCDFMFAALCH